MHDLVQQRPALFLGSRLKRIGEHMQTQVAALVEEAGLPLQPSQMPLMGLLATEGPQTIGALADALRLKQPTVSRAVQRLAALGFADITQIDRDQRLKTVSLTPAGSAALTRAKLVIWPRIETAVAAMLEGLQGPLLAQLDALEAAIETNPLDRRAGAFPEAGLTILPWSDDLAPVFKSINAEWIEAMYSLEPTDRDVLDNPKARFIETGGDILFVHAADVGIIGTCALQKTGDHAFELTKMGVRAAARGAKAGEFLLRATIARALALGADPLYLLTNKKSAAAIHLYEKLGFRHDKGIMARYGARYARCDVAMRYAP